MHAKSASKKHAKPSTSSHIVTRSQKRQELVAAHKESDICICPTPDIMNEDTKQEFKHFFADLVTALQGDMEKESQTQRAQLDSLQTKLDKKSSAQNLKPDIFDGNPLADATEWLDAFRRIAKLNNWSSELQLNAFPLYLKGIAHAWFLALPDEKQNDFTALTTAFQERFASGPQDWILSQKLSARKHIKGEPIDDYITDITRLCKRLKLSDVESMRYFIEGLQSDLQAYVSLGRPKNFREAESLARMKDIVNQRQGVSDTQSIITQMQAMFNKLMAQSSDSSKVVAAVAPAPVPSATDKRVDELAQQLKQFQKQQQHQKQQQKQQQYATAHYAMAAYDQPPGQQQQMSPSRNWEGHPNRQMEQLQRQVMRLENELKRYQNPRRPDFRSFGRSYRSTEGDPICTYCNRVGHTWRVCRQRERDPRLPPTNGPSRPSNSRPPFNRPPLNG